MTAETAQVQELEDLEDDRVREVVAEICETIHQRFPTAIFRIYRNPTYRGAVIQVYTDTEDIFPVTDPILDRLVDLLVDEDISIQVTPRHRRWLRAA